MLEPFRRPAGEEVSSEDSSVMFLLFAQWFTDSFLRTDRSDGRKNPSTQEIDFCQIYRLSETRTRLLRSMQGGRMTTRTIDGQAYPTATRTSGSIDDLERYVGIGAEDRPRTR